MGSLAVAGVSGDSSPAPAAAEPSTPALEPDEGAGDDGGGEEERRPSRRNKTQALIEQQFGELNKRWDERFQQTERTWQGRLAEEQAERARLQGQLEQLHRQQSERREPPTVQEDPAELKRKAKEALDRKDFDEYERLNDRATDLRAERRLDERLRAERAEIEKRIPRQQPPLIQNLLATHGQVAAAGERGERLVTAMAEELQVYGWKPGPQLVTEAFKLAEQRLAAQAQNARAGVPSYDQSAAAQAALAGVPARGAPAGAETGGGATAPKLSPYEESVRAKLGWTPEQYVAWKTDPEKAREAERKKRR